jgi:uncharacterized phage protein (TIGR01671 family)
MVEWDGVDGTRTYFREMSLDPDTILMQYTNLKDKNGTEIWEGDLVRIKIHGDDPLISPIEFAHAGFWPIDYDTEYGWPAPDELEVIGNIYENPELMHHS